MKTSRIIFFLGALLLPMTLSAQSQNCKASLCGFVTDSKTKKPIAFAEVLIEGTGLGVVTDEHGKFHIHNICDGTYTVVSRHLGCPHVAKEIVISGNVEVDFQLSHEALELQKVVVIGSSIIPHHIQSRQVLSGSHLDMQKGKAFGDILKTLPGVDALSTGPNVSKPIIHGLHSNRVLIINNGVRLEGQQWGTEHGPEIDPFSADHISVVMGANSVRYGADALGGVVIAEPRPMRKEKGTTGELQAIGHSNGGTAAFSGMLEQRWSEKFPLNTLVQGTLKRSGSIRTPEYFLENTGVSEFNYMAATNYQKKDLELGISYSSFSSDVGLFEGAHAESLDDFFEAIERGRPEEKGEFHYDFGGPLQRVQHNTLKATAKLHNESLGILSLSYARQGDRRQEFEGEHGEEIDFDDPEARFDLTTHSIDLTLDHNPWKNFRGAFGIQHLRQNNSMLAGDLIPDYSSNTTGVFWLERWRKYPLPVELEAGFRYDVRNMHVDQRAGQLIDKNFSFNNLTGTVGVIYHFPKNFAMRFSLGSAWRSPSVSELYSDGVHEGTASYEIGSETLVPERMYSTALNLSYSRSHNRQSLRISLDLFNNLVSDFIYLEPQQQPVVTDEGTYPAFHYKQVDARLRGVDFNVIWKPLSSIALSSSASLLRAWNKTAEEPLVFMPPDKLQHNLTYYFRQKKTGVEAPFMRLTLVNVMKQSRVPDNQDYAAAPDAYTIVNFESAYVFVLGKQNLRAALGVDNLFNVSYRDYLNRLRYFAHEPGRDVYLSLNYTF